MGPARKNLVFNMFADTFVYFPHFMIFSYVKQIRIKIANTKTLETVLTGYVASVFSSHTGVIT